MAIPKECRMADLSDLASHLVINRLIVQLLVGEPGLSKKARSYRRNFVRLIDKAIREYQEARNAILGEISGKRQLLLMGFTDHIETCINTIRRLYNLLEKMKSEKGNFKLPRELRKQVISVEKSVIGIRDAIQHIDELIIDDQIEDGEPVMATISENEDSIVIGKYYLKFEELAMVLRKMNEIALHFLSPNHSSDTSI